MMASSSSNHHQEAAARPEILSLDEFNVAIPQDVYDHLSKQYASLNEGGNSNKTEKHIDTILDCMKRSPVDTCCRVNNIHSSVNEVQNGLRNYLMNMECCENDGDERHQNRQQCEYMIQKHDILSDLITIRATSNNNNNLYYSKVPPNKKQSTTTDMKDIIANDLFPTWQLRHEQGWPITHRCVIIDRFCAEAVLRGADIFVKGILCADAGITEGEEVAVYANLPRSINSSSKSIITTRGMLLQNYTDRCVFIGIGISKCKRADYFAQSSGLGVTMTSIAGPSQPPMNGVLGNKMVLQNLPSIVVGHALDPQPGEVILDMCCAPGGKTTQVASLMNDNGLIIACDKSRRKMISCRDFFQAHASCIVPLALDSTKALISPLNSSAAASEDEWKSPKAIIDAAPIATDGLKDVKGFYANSFDRILLDPPCSALGLRPKLQIDIKSSKELLKASEYQHRNAVPLLKVGGVMTYSTCTINAYENEHMVKFILDVFPCMRLVSLSHLPGQPGLPDMGLTEDECKMVRRFDPTDASLDTMGFFLAKFQKV
jgi:16S rRNA C967 or C1407 C5-methylase (RsmB/RsmF family)/predicted ribosome-associated RNA-binding protein Tma20